MDRFLRHTTQKEPALTASFLAAVLLATAGRYLNLTDCAETETNGIGCELVSHLRTALHFELGEQRRGQGLASFGSGVVPQTG